MKSVKLVLTTAIKSIENTAKLFYQQRENEGYNAFNDTINHIEMVINVIGNMTQKNSNIDIHKILYSMNQAMEALVIRDSILLADILLYDLMEEFKNI